MQLARHEAVVDEEIFLDRQARITALEVTRAITGDAMAKREVLRAGRRADRVGLDEAQPRDRLHQRGRTKQGSRDRVAAQVVEDRWLHRPSLMSQGSPCDALNTASCAANARWYAGRASPRATYAARFAYSSSRP